MLARTIPGTHNPRTNAHTVTDRLREIGETSPYTMYVLYVAFLFWPSIICWKNLKKKTAPDQAAPLGAGWSGTT